MLKRVSPSGSNLIFRLHQAANLKSSANWMARNTERSYTIWRMSTACSCSIISGASTRTSRVEPQDPQLFPERARSAAFYRNHPHRRLVRGAIKGPQPSSTKVSRPVAILDGTAIHRKLEQCESAGSALQLSPAVPYLPSSRGISVEWKHRPCQHSNRWSLYSRRTAGNQRHVAYHDCISVATAT